jgi:uncharacterized SAM-binding protein YcdF (DUF218 family)
MFPARAGERSPGRLSALCGKGCSCNPRARSVPVGCFFATHGHGVRPGLGLGIGRRLVYNLISYLLHPYVFVLLLLGLALARLWYKRPELRRSLLWPAVPYFLLVVLSTPTVGYLAVGSLEWQIAAQEERPQDTEAIVVLDGGGLLADRQRQRPDLSASSLRRTLHAARLYHQASPCPVLVSGGGKFNPGTPEPLVVDLMAELLSQQGVRPSDLIVERNSRTTYENAVESRKLLEKRGIKRIVLVTDAIHLPRAVRCFHKQGFEVIPSGCHYRATEFKPSPYYFLPGIEGLSGTEEAAHEWAGFTWYWCAGRI